MRNRAIETLERVSIAKEWKHPIIRICHCARAAFGGDGPAPSPLPISDRFFCEDEVKMRNIQLMSALGAGVLLSGAALGAGGGSGCRPGDEKCPLILKMTRGSDTISFSCALSSAKPGCAAKFEARAAQVATLRGDQIAHKVLIFPSGDGTDELELGPVALPETGTYTLVLTYGASLMSRDEKARPATYSWTLRIR